MTHAKTTHAEYAIRDRAQLSARRRVRIWPLHNGFLTLDHMTASLRIRRALLAPAFITLFAGCGVTDHLSGHSISPVSGTYSALVFRVTPSGQAPIDVLAQGGVLT